VNSGKVQVSNGEVLHLINKDLKFLGVNRNVAETLRTMASKLHMKRTTARKK